MLLSLHQTRVLRAGDELILNYGSTAAAFVNSGAYTDEAQASLPHVEYKNVVPEDVLKQYLALREKQRSKELQAAKEAELEIRLKAQELLDASKSAELSTSTFEAFRKYVAIIIIVIKLQIFMWRLCVHFLYILCSRDPVFHQLFQDFFSYMSSKQEASSPPASKKKKGAQETTPVAQNVTSTSARAHASALLPLLSSPPSPASSSASSPASPSVSSLASPSASSPSPSSSSLEAPVPGALNFDAHDADADAGSGDVGDAAADGVSSSTGSSQNKRCRSDNVVHFTVTSNGRLSQDDKSLLQITLLMGKAIRAVRMDYGTTSQTARRGAEETDDTFFYVKEDDKNFKDEKVQNALKRFKKAQNQIAEHGWRRYYFECYWKHREGDYPPLHDDDYIVLEEARPSMRRVKPARGQPTGGGGNDAARNSTREQSTYRLQTWGQFKLDLCRM